MYPSLGDLLTSVYSTCFPIDESKGLPDERLKEINAFRRRIQRIEKTDDSTNLTIDEFIDNSMPNITSVFPSHELREYIREIIRGFLIGYSRIFVFNEPTYLSKPESEDYIFRFYIPTVPELSNEMYIKFGMLDESPRLKRDWYYPQSGIMTEPFISVLQWIIKQDGRSQGKIAKDAAIRTGSNADANEMRIKRWLHGENLPSIHECVHLLGLEASQWKQCLFLYLSIIISTYFRAFPDKSRIVESISIANRFGRDHYLYSIGQHAPDDLCNLMDRMIPLLMTTRKEAPNLQVKITSFIDSNKQIIDQYHLKYMTEMMLARYYLHSAKDYSTAIAHYEKAFEEGKYRAGRFQKQICLEYLHCLSHERHKVPFKRVYLWMRLYENFMGTALLNEEIECSELFETLTSSNVMVYRYEDEGIVFQP